MFFRDCLIKYEVSLKQTTHLISIYISAVNVIT